MKLNSIKIVELRKIMEFLDEYLDTGVGFTEREWLDILDELESKYGENASVTKKRMEIYLREED